MKRGDYVFVKSQRALGVGVLLRLENNNARVHFYEGGEVLDFKAGDVDLAPAGVFDKSEQTN